MEKEVRKSEAPSQSRGEAPFVKIVRRLVHKEIPQHAKSFDIVLDDIDRQVSGDGLYVFESQQFSGVKFLGIHLEITPDLIRRVNKEKFPPQLSAQETETNETENQHPRPEHYIYVIQPATGVPPDGSGLSGLDMGIARAINTLPIVAEALRSGQTPPTIDIYMVGDPASLGGKTTEEFNELVRKEGFGAYAKLYAEQVNAVLPENLDRTRIILQGPSKGAITSDLTFDNLTDEVQNRTQLLFDNPAGNHDGGIATRIGRGANLIAGSIYEIAARFAGRGTVTVSDFKGQKEYYDQVVKERGLEDSDEQKNLKKQLFGMELSFNPLTMTNSLLANGTPLSTEHRSYSRISTPDPVNIDFDNLSRVIRGAGERILGIPTKTIGKRRIFATGHTYHSYPWLRNMKSWARKMEFVENSKSIGSQ